MMVRRAYRYRFYPHQEQRIQLAQTREWDCVCGSHNLRDYNAALNLLAVGRTVLA